MANVHNVETPNSRVQSISRSTSHLKGEKRMLNALHKFFHLAKHVYGVYERLRLETVKALPILNQYVEQYEAVSSVQTSKLEIGKFDDIQEKLLAKIQADIESELQEIVIQVKEFQKLPVKVVEALTDVMNTWLDDEIILFMRDGSPTIPSMSMLLRWAADLCLYFETKEEVTCLFVYEEWRKPVTWVGLLRNVFKEETTEDHLVKGIFAHVQFFMEEKM